MPLIVIPIIGLAAILHAAWNVILKTSGDPLLVAYRLNLVSVVVAWPLVAGFWIVRGGTVPSTEALALALVSGILEAAYFVALSTAYRHGDLSVVYPIARGSAPLLAVVVGVVVFGEALAVAGWLGVACLLVGILVAGRPWKAVNRRDAQGRRRLDPAVGFALLTGAFIVAYSAVDRAGVRMVDPLLYGAMLFTVATVCLWVWIAIRRPSSADRPRPAKAGGDTGVAGGEVDDPGGVSWRLSAIAGTIAFLAYVLVLFALSIAPLAVVAPLRESAIVIVSAFGAIQLAEASGRQDVARRVGAAVLIVIGIGLLVLGA